MSLATAALLGGVEGLTEFLPVSSTGHLILAGHFLNFTGEKAATFEIFIQLGAILSVLVAYPQRFLGLLDFKESYGFRGIRGIGRLMLTTLPALVLGFLFHKKIKEFLFNPLSVAAALILGGIWILIIENRKENSKVQDVDSMTWTQCLGIGFFQCLAMWPGMSRSASTILGGMMLGLDRKTAVEYSFFAAVPVLCAATLLDLVKSLPVLNTADLPFFGVGLIISFITALIVIKIFIGFVSRFKLTGFGWYRIAAGLAVFLLLHK